MRFALLSASLLLAAPVFADDAPPPSHVDFQVDVAQTTANDQLTARLGTDVSDPDPAVVAQKLTEVINHALKVGAGYPTVKLTSGNQQSWPVYGSGSNSTRLQGWRGRAELRLESQDFKAAGQLIAQLQGQLQLGGLDFSVADKTRRSVEGQLSQQAIAAFRTRADLIREAWNAKGYRLVTMNISSSDGGQVVRPLFMARSAMATPAAAPAEDFSGGDTQLTVHVSGTIELEP